MVLNQPCYIIPTSPDLSPNYRFSLIQHNILRLFPDLQKVSPDHFLACISLPNCYTYTISECAAVLTRLGDAFSTAFSALTALCKKLPFNWGEPPEMAICLRLWGEPRIPYGSGLTRLSGWVSSSDWKREKLTKNKIQVAKHQSALLLGNNSRIKSSTSPAQTLSWTNIIQKTDISKKNSKKVTKTQIT